MTLDEYQQQALSTALPTALDAEYLLPGLVGEVGELMSIIAKARRDKPKPTHHDNLKKELGDIMWFVAVLAHVYGLNLDAVGQANLAKLASRQSRGVLGGSGDER